MSKRKVGLVAVVLLLGLFSFESSNAVIIAPAAVRAPLISLDDPTGSSMGLFYYERGEFGLNLDWYMCGNDCDGLYLAYGYVASDGRLVFGCTRDGFVPFYEIQENGWMALVKADDLGKAINLAGRIHSCPYYKRLNFPPQDPVVSNEDPYQDYGPTMGSFGRWFW